MWGEGHFFLFYILIYPIFPLFSLFVWILHDMTATLSTGSLNLNWANQSFGDDGTSWYWTMTNETWHDKTNKVTVRPGKSQISLGIRCALNGLLRTQAFFMRTAKTLIRLGGFPGWSETSLGAHSLCWFCHVTAQMVHKPFKLWCLWPPMMKMAVDGHQ